jgi:predicted ester cyclase
MNDRNEQFQTESDSAGEPDLAETEAACTITANADALDCYLTEVLNGGDLTKIEHLFAAKHVTHGPDGDLFGPEGVRLDVVELRAAFTGISIEAEQHWVDETLAVRRFVVTGTHCDWFLGCPPSHQHVALPGFAVDRFAEGRFIESWVYFDVKSLQTA